MSFNFSELLDFKRQKGPVSTFDEDVVTAEVEGCREAFFTSGSTADCLANLANYAAVSRKRLRNHDRPCPKLRTIEVVKLIVSRWMMEDPPEELASPEEIRDWLRTHRGYVQHARNWAAGNVNHRQHERAGQTRRSLALHFRGVGDAALQKLNHLIAEVETTIADSVEKLDPNETHPEPRETEGSPDDSAHRAEPHQVDERGNRLLF